MILYPDATISHLPSGADGGLWITEALQTDKSNKLELNTRYMPYSMKYLSPGGRYFTGREFKGFWHPELIR